MPISVLVAYFQMIQAAPMTVAVLPGEEDVDLPRWDRACAIICFPTPGEVPGRETPAGNSLPV